MKLAVILLCAILLSGCSGGPSVAQTPTPPVKRPQPSATDASTADATTRPDMPDFQEIMVVDNEDCAIYISDFREDPVWGWVLDARLENKSEEENRMFAVSSASVNTVQIDPLFASQVAPGKKAKEQIHLSVSALQEQDIGPYTDIELYFRVYDPEDWMEEPIAAPSIHIYPYGADRAQPYVRPAETDDRILVDRGDFRVTAIGFAQDPIWGFTTQLFIENKTDRQVMLTAEDVSINGFMADPLFAVSVDPGNCAFGRMSWSDTLLEELEVAQVEEIEFTLRAYDESDWEAEDLLHIPVTLSTKSQ